MFTGGAATFTRRRFCKSYGFPPVTGDNIEIVSIVKLEIIKTIVRQNVKRSLFFMFKYFFMLFTSKNKDYIPILYYV